MGWDADRGGQRRRVAFDEDNRIQAVADQGRTTDFRYDDDTTRVIKRGPGGEVIYVNQWYVDNAGKNSKHVFAGTTRIVTKLEMPPKSQPPSQQPPGPGTGTTEKFFYFYHPDHLGSTSYVTDQSGEVYQHLEYFPFGETWVDESPGNSTDRTPYRFTGKEFDEETGLYYFGARYYDPRISLWTAADPALGEYLDGKPGSGVFEPRNVNLFGYVQQNPLIQIDPDGRFTYKVGTEIFSTDSGDTLNSISKMTGVPGSQLMQQNPGVFGSPFVTYDGNKSLPAGKSIFIPDKRNILAFKWAASQIDKPDYGEQSDSGYFGFAVGDDKCNIFVAHAYTKGAKSGFPRRSSWRNTFGLENPPSAQSLASDKLEGTTLISEAEAVIGDLIGWDRGPGHQGHNAIFTGELNISGQSRPRGDWGSIGAGKTQTNYRSKSHMEGVGDKNPTFRRIDN